MSSIKIPIAGSWLSSLKTKLGFFGDPIKNQREKGFFGDLDQNQKELCFEL